MNYKPPFPLGAILALVSWILCLGVVGLVFSVFVNLMAWVLP
jgi:hypothetical protein